MTPITYHTIRNFVNYLTQYFLSDATRRNRRRCKPAGYYTHIKYEIGLTRDPGASGMKIKWRSENQIGGWAELHGGSARSGRGRRFRNGGRAALRAGVIVVTAGRGPGGGRPGVFSGHGRRGGLGRGRLALSPLRLPAPFLLSLPLVCARARSLALFLFVSLRLSLYTLWSFLCPFPLSPL